MEPRRATVLARAAGADAFGPGAVAAGAEAAGDATPPELPILVVPSREEGFGLVLLEGMARGLSIVATTAGGIPEVARDGIEAILAPPRNPRLLAGALERALGDPALRARLSRAGRARVAAFPIHSMVEGYLATYQEVLADRPGRGSR
jgi:glycosyltransferase involved in cell wall biosynthesis